MGTINTEITLKNAYEEGSARRGLIKPEEVKTVTVTAVVDTGAMYMVIPDELRRQLGLTVVEETSAHIANGEQVTCQITDAVGVCWKDRRTEIPAMVIPCAKKVLFGALALEAMDLIIHPKTQEIVGAHGDRTEFLALFMGL